MVDINKLPSTIRAFMGCIGEPKGKVLKHEPYSIMTPLYEDSEKEIHLTFGEKPHVTGRDKQTGKTVRINLEEFEKGQPYKNSSDELAKLTSELGKKEYKLGFKDFKFRK